MRTTTAKTIKQTKRIPPIVIMITICLTLLIPPQAEALDQQLEKEGRAVITLAKSFQYKKLNESFKSIEEMEKAANYKVMAKHFDFLNVSMLKAMSLAGVDGVYEKFVETPNKNFYDVWVVQFYFEPASSGLWGDQFVVIKGGKVKYVLLMESRKWIDEHFNLNPLYSFVIILFAILISYFGYRFFTKRKKTRKKQVR